MTNKVTESKKKQDLLDSTNSEIKVLRRNYVRNCLSTQQEKEIAIDSSDNSLMASVNDENKTRYQKDTSLIMTQLGYINITSISDDGLKVSGYLNQSPHIKFYSGELFKNVARSDSPKIRKNAKNIKCVPGFIDTTSRKVFQLTTISANEIRCVSADDITDIHIESFQMNEHTYLLKWIIGSFPEGVTYIQYTT